MRAFVVRKLSGLARRIQRTIKVERRVWIDVGAHLGESTIYHALADPTLLVFAFEPDWNLTRQIMGRAANFVALPMAVSDSDGFSDFHLNAIDHANSLLPFCEESRESGQWKGIGGLVEERTVIVPTIRLDTFMNRMRIAAVEHLKIDAQGLDFRVIQSAGSRINDIRSVTLEVDLAPVRLYSGSAGKDEIVQYMLTHGLELTNTAPQNGGKEENLTFTRPFPAQ